MKNVTCLSAITLIVVMALGLHFPAYAQDAPRPNILWLTCEDMSPNLGCYGDQFAVSPNIDRLAGQGMRYTHAFSPIGVCAPSRSCLITGMYASSIGTQHMRCDGTLPEQVRCFPEYLRRAGYYCTNNVKTDYNFKHAPETWDESSRNAHWRNRRPGQPFFSVFNITTTHESQIRIAEQAYQERTKNFTAQQRHDPAKAPIPAYHPDTPEVRKDWARYADNITHMDQEMGAILAQLEADGLAGETIVCFFSDHGAGMPRSKRWLYDSSTRVPLIVRCPQKYAQLSPGAAGTTTDRLVSFVDFGPTVLSLAGVDVPEHMQGEPFLGKQATAPRQYVFGYRDRMDERYDMVRTVRDQRYRYIRNYMPHLPYFHHQFVSYMYEMPTMQAWQRLADAGKLSGPTAVFMTPEKPMEELYDSEADPHEVRNLAAAPEHQQTLGRLRAAHRQWMREIVDLGLLPEPELRSRYAGKAEYEAVRRDPSSYPFDRIAAAADLANARAAANVPKLIELLKDEDAAVRYWAVTGLGAMGQQAASNVDALKAAAVDRSPTVRVAAADALCRIGQTNQAVPILAKALEDQNDWVRLYAMNVLDRHDQQSQPAKQAIEKCRQDKNQYVVRVVEHTLQGLTP